MKAGHYRWVRHGMGKLYQVGILEDGTLYNPNHYPDELVREVVLPADAHIIQDYHLVTANLQELMDRVDKVIRCMSEYSRLCKTLSPQEVDCLSRYARFTYAVSAHLEDLREPLRYLQMQWHEFLSKEERDAYAWDDEHGSKSEEPASPQPPLTQS